MSSSVSGDYKCDGEKGCYCYKLETCEEECKFGKCVVPTAPQAKGATGDAACATIGKSCVSSTCGDCATPADKEGCIATCK